ncbi:transposase [Paenibacillus sp. WST5]|uniref:Transposase n=2 Tax=Paenibacillus sedimenti TaxID=2770274 RepID=A0A926QJ14_9BACL|nr:transposase [Paenibacillus sedimenti]
MKKRWSNGFCCPNCDNNTFYKIQTRNLLECKECSVQISLTAGTVMHNSKLSLLLWFQAIQALIRNDQNHTISSLAKLLGVNYRTAKLLIAKIQLALHKDQTQLGSNAQKSQRADIQHENKHSATKKGAVNLRKFYFQNSRSVTFPEEILFTKWMSAFLSVRLFPIFLKCYKVL